MFSSSLRRVQPSVCQCWLYQVFFRSFTFNIFYSLSIYCCFAKAILALIYFVQDSSFDLIDTKYLNTDQLFTQVPLYMCCQRACVLVVSTFTISVFLQLRLHGLLIIGLRLFFCLHIDAACCIVSIIIKFEYTCIMFPPILTPTFSILEPLIICPVY